jgi:hypothetical protein
MDFKDEPLNFQKNMFPINDFAKTTLQFAAKTSKFYEKDP